MVCSSSIHVQIWLFGYELNDTICIFTRNIVYILSSKKEIEFLKPIENRLKTLWNENEPAIKLIVRDQVNGLHFDAINLKI